jgi:hypothetical protein
LATISQAIQTLRAPAGLYRSIQGARIVPASFFILPENRTCMHAGQLVFCFGFDDTFDKNLMSKLLLARTKQ